MPTKTALAIRFTQPRPRRPQTGRMLTDALAKADGLHSPMTDSYLQDEFLRVFADGHKATAKRIVSKLTELNIAPELHSQIRDVVAEEIRGLYHGNLVVFDGGSSLADHGLIKIVDDRGTPFITYLHEICFRFYGE
jgi:hypothetical protein